MWTLRPDYAHMLGPDALCALTLFLVANLKTIREPSQSSTRPARHAACPRAVSDGPAPVGRCCVFDPNATAFFEQWTRLERDMLLDVWSTRRKADPFLIGQYLFASLGWLASIPAVSCYAVVLGSAHRSAADTMPLAFKAAAILSLVEFTSQIGAAQISDWISTWVRPSGAPSPGLADERLICYSHAFEPHVWAARVEPIANEVRQSS